MPYTHRDPELQWTPLSVRGWKREQLELAEQCLHEVLAAWEGSKYESGQSVRGLVADCIGGVFGCVDDLDGQNRRAPAGMPSDVAMHQRDTAVAAMRVLIQRYQPAVKVKANSVGIFVVQPGDLLVTGQSGGGPGHIAMVGPQKNTMWEAVPSTGFARQGWSLDSTQVVWAVYRLMNKEQWLEAR